MDADFNLQYCEKCEQMILFTPQKNDIMYECPICGTINDIVNIISMKGIFELQSPTVIVETDAPVNNELTLELGNDEIEKAMKVLIAHGWKLKFRSEQE
jgi:DNA-directed RNA polymerase subunit M/transcription elongation factor TFIIS